MGFENILKPCELWSEKNWWSGREWEGINDGIWDSEEFRKEVVTSVRGWEFLKIFENLKT